MERDPKKMIRYVRMWLHAAEMAIADGEFDDAYTDLHDAKARLDDAIAGVEAKIDARRAAGAAKDPT